MNDSIPLKSTNFYKPLVRDYLSEKDTLMPFISGFPELGNFERRIEDKFTPSSTRNLLSEVLNQQYQNSSAITNPLVKSNINLLKDSRTFTVCTGHQLNLFSGPFYFLIKIAQTISLSRILKKNFPGYNFVPVYWMATEDHDLEEIDHFNLFGKKKKWETNQSGATGRMNTGGVEELAENVLDLFARNEEAQRLINSIKMAYANGKSLADATRSLVHILFKEEEIVVLDADCAKLKGKFKPLIKKELTEKIVFKSLTETNKILTSKGYHSQVNPRDINLFYLKDFKRTRIIGDGENFKTSEHRFSWTQDEILKELEEHPERFSPNAAFRPVYQELILPNLANIGGPGEVSYWLQLKSLFDEFKVDFPFLVMRNSFSFVSKSDFNLVQDFNLKFEDLFQRQEDMVKHATLSSVGFSLENEMDSLGELLKNIISKVEEVDTNIISRVHGVFKETEKKLLQLESKVVKSIKNQNEVKLKKLVRVQDSIFPSGALSERSLNFLELMNYMTWGKLKLILLKEDLPLKSCIFIEKY